MLQLRKSTYVVEESNPECDPKSTRIQEEHLVDLEGDGDAQASVSQEGM